MTEGRDVYAFTLAEVAATRRSRRWIITTTGVGFMVIVAVLTVFFSGQHLVSQSLKIDQTLDPLVIKVLNETALNMNSTVDPCEDFYEYACGSFRQKYPLFKNKSDVNYYTLYYQKVRRHILDRLNGHELLVNETFAPFKYLKRVWDSCVNDESDTSEQFVELDGYFTEIDPLPTWESMFRRLTKDGYNVLFTVKTIESNDRNTFLVNPPKMELASAYSTEESSPLLDYYTDLIELYKSNLAKEEQIKLAREIIEFEHWLYTNATPSTERQKASHSIKVSELNRNTGVMWRKLMEDIPDKAMTDDVRYIKNFKKIIENKSLDFLTNYLKLAVLHQNCFFLGKQCRQWHFRMIQSINQEVDRHEYEEETCFNFLKQHFQDALFRLYETRPSKEDEFEGMRVELDLEKMVCKVRDKFRALIPKISWIADEGDTKKALKRLSRIATEQNKPTRSLERKYADVPFVNSTKSVDLSQYFQNILKYKKKRESEDLVSSPNWRASLFDALPTFSQDENSMLVTPYMNQTHFFLPDLPEGLRWGLLGSMIGHELTHVFDGAADHFIQVAELKAFWTNRTRQEFKKQMQCLVEAYNEQNVEVNGQATELKIDGSSTLNENLADMIGVEMAYEAFHQFDSNLPFDTSQFPNLTQLTYPVVRDELFFLSYANIHCSNDVMPSAAQMQLKNQAPPKYRVNLALAHTEKFAKVFKCKEGSKMNPATKCSFRLID